jgi:hypothetical protein
MEEKVIINGPITLSRETYKIWKRVFPGYKEQKLEKRLYKLIFFNHLGGEMNRLKGEAYGQG